MTTLPSLPGIPSTKLPVAPAQPKRTWSQYQEAIFQAAVKGAGNVVVEAVAGSGKTSTMVELFNRWQAAGNQTKRACFVCFNKSVATELERRVPAGIEAKTLHGMSFGAIRRAMPKCTKVDEHKLDDHARVVVDKQYPDTVQNAKNRQITQDLCRAYGLLKGTMTVLTDVLAITNTLAEYSIELDAVNEALPLFAELDRAMRADLSRLTYDEMLSFIVDHNIAMPKYSLVAVDECQDLNLLQIAIVGKMLAADGRLFAVGDSRQSLYMFRGADSNAMNRIRQQFKVPSENQLPLSITYRCPRAVVAAAQEFVPEIEAAPSAPEGTVERRADTVKAFNRTLDELEPGMMVVCHANAPLVTCALRLISERRRAKIKGRDIGKAIGKLAKDLLKKASNQSVASLARVVREYQHTQVEKLRAAHKDRQADTIEDKCETLLAVIDGAHSLNDVEARLEMLFSDTDDSSAVMFSSVHRAKGLEAETVVWLGPEITDWIEGKAKTEQAAIQCKNVRYVAITRAKSRLLIQPIPRPGEDG